MKLVKPHAFVKSEWLWQHDDDGERDVNVFDGLDMTSIVFGIFYLDKFARDVKPQLETLLEKAQNLLQVWNLNYPWSEYNKIYLRYEELENQEPFIFGQLCVEDNVRDEESLIVALLQRLSSELGQQVFIRVCDTDGDFILAEVNDAIPEEYEYPMANNRLWLHEGNFKMIPTYFHPDRGLRPQEALKFLEESYFKCLEIEKINTAVSTQMTKGYPNQYLSTLVRLPLMLEDKECYKILTVNRQIISFLLKNLMKEDVKVSAQAPEETIYTAEFLVPQSHCDLLSLFLDEKDLRKDSNLLPLYCGRAISQVLRTLLESGVVLLEDIAIKEEENMTGNSMFATRNFKSASLNSMVTQDNDIGFDEKIMEKLNDFFTDGFAVDDGYDSTKNSSFNLPDEDKSEYSDGASKQYFKDQNVGIDEDDFFEFFLKDALKLKNESISSFRREESDESIGTQNDAPEEEEKALDELEAIYKESISEEDSLNVVHDLLESISIDGAPNGPLQTMIQSLGRK